MKFKKPLKIKFYTQVYSPSHSQLYSQLERQLYNQLENQLNIQLYNQLHNQLLNQFDKIVEAESRFLKKAVDILQKSDRVNPR